MALAMLKTAVRNVLERIPPAAELLRRRRMRRRFPNEMALLEGRSRPDGSGTSVVLFTQHKCASVYTRELFRTLALDSGLIPVNYENLVFNGEVLPHERERIYGAGGKAVYPERGYCFAPIRAWHAGIPDPESYRTVLMLRDPRDVLVSFYFSMAYSHSVPEADTAVREHVLAERETAAVADIDSYVIERSGFFLETYENYLQNVFGRPNVLFVTYEQMVGDYEGWLDRVVEHCGFTPSPATRERLVRESNFQVDQEDPTRHRRQVTPGDHRRKLRPETIEALNQRFAKVLESLGYAR